MLFLKQTIIPMTSFFFVEYVDLQEIKKVLNNLNSVF